MAGVWTAPRTWVPGEVLPAGTLNGQIRDNLMWLGQADGVSAAPPTAPQDRQHWWYPADVTAGVVWHFRYAAGSGSASKWEAAGANAPVYAEVLAAFGTSSATFVATNGPSLTLARAGDYVVAHGCHNSGGTSNGAMSYSTGATVASDNDACYVNSGATTQAQQSAKTRVKQGIQAGAALIANYRTLGTSSTFDLRWIMAAPVRVA